VQQKIRKMRGEVMESLNALVEKQRNLAQSAKALSEKGYPAEASEIAIGVKENALRTSQLIETLPVKQEEGILWYVIIGVIALIVGIAGGILLGYSTFSRR